MPAGPGIRPRLHVPDARARPGFRSKLKAGSAGIAGAGSAPRRTVDLDTGVSRSLVSRTILAGIHTAAVVSIGVETPDPWTRAARCGLP